MGNPTDMTTNDTAATDGAPELHAFHDAWFDAAEANQSDIYESEDDWSPVKRSGHFRRMAILDRLLPANVAEMSAVDFGSGPWGFGCIIPGLRAARECFCIDVSQRALEISQEKDSEIAAKTTYLVSDGETIPLPDDSIDIFWGGEVIEHVRCPALFFQEVARICRDGATVILSTPNRDAIYYKIRGEQNTVGPEHIALMNDVELGEIAARFCSDHAIVGYEFSLHGDLDWKFSADADLDAIQKRAWSSPETATGLILKGKIAKKLFHENARSWELRELSWSSPQVAASESAASVRLFDGVAGGSLSPLATMSFQMQGQMLILLFWAHPWSGVVEITVNGQTEAIDLYSPEGGFRRLERQALEVFDVQIRRPGRRCDASQGTETIFYKAMVYSMTNPATPGTGK